MVLIVGGKISIDPLVQIYFFYIFICSKLILETTIHLINMLSIHGSKAFLYVAMNGAITTILSKETTHHLPIEW